MNVIPDCVNCRWMEPFVLVSRCRMQGYNPGSMLRADREGVK
jgi:hypothetical protein